jgi:hypothetical protein
VRALLTLGLTVVPLTVYRLALFWIALKTA